MKKAYKKLTRQPPVAPFMALAGELRSLIRRKAYAPGDWLGTETRLAKENRISRMTARRAVQALVDEGLVERRPGRGLFIAARNAQPRIVRFMAGNMLWTPAVRVAHAVQEAAGAAGFTVEVFDARGDLATFIREMSALCDGRFAGAVAMSQHDPSFSRAVVELAAARFPLAVVDQTLADIPVASVASDNRRGGYLAAREFIALGHRHLAFLGDLAADTTAARAQGAADACAEALVPPPARYDIPGQRFDDWEPAIRRRVEEIMASTPRPTGVVCSCDAVARHVMRALADMGVAVPAGISVSGFDDDPIAEWTTPAITTVRQDFDAMGRRAFDLLLQSIDNGNGAALHSDISVAIVRRNSIAAPATAPAPTGGAGGVPPSVPLPVAI